ncbi:MAG: histidine phosphatase family protein, partial [Nanoarchaeota archaeon]|nr:histidine phosphatase family protein [Nanoarchaeota archaeon]
LIDKNKFSAVYASDSIRAQQTARYATERPWNSWPLYQISPKLAEIDQGGLEGRLKEEVMEKMHRSPVKDWWTYVPHGGKESQADVYRRVVEFLENDVIPNYQGNVLLFTHANVIKSFHAGLFAPTQAEKDKIHRTRVRNCSVSIYRYYEGSVWPVTFAKDDHLPPETRRFGRRLRKLLRDTWQGRKK